MIERASALAAAPEIDWLGDLPQSRSYQDHYFSRENGLAEARHVFLEGARVADAWHAAKIRGSDTTTVFELGFGTGLNFLATAELWRTLHRANDAFKLRYISVEAFPLTPNAARRALRRWLDQLHLAEDFIARIPPRIRGQHRVQFKDAKIELVLLIDDVRTALGDLQVTAPFIDVIYLDGFAPAKNPAMWDFGVLKRLAELSVDGARLSTFSAAGELRRRLARVGFDVHKRPGYGRKRDMVTAIRTGTTKPRRLRDSDPWYALPAPNRPQHVAVIGAGLAGSATAHALAMRGVQSTVFDRAGHVAAESSSVPIAGWFPQLSLDFDSRSEFFWQACTALDSLLREQGTTDNWFDRRGCFFVAYDDDRRRHLKRIGERLSVAGLPIEFVEGNAARSRHGIDRDIGGLDCSLGGSLVPARLCSDLLKHPLINVTLATCATPRRAADGSWQVSGEKLGSQCFDAVVIATGVDTRFVESLLPANFQVSDGQVRVLSLAKLRAQRRLLCSRSYLTTAIGPGNGYGASADGGRHLGALLGFNTAETGRPQPTEAAPTSPWNGRRVASRDRLPLVGPVPCRASLKAALETRRRSGAMRNFATVEYERGLFVNIAHGGRGASSALLCGQLIAEIMCDEPLSLPRRLINTIHPARFQVRDTFTQMRHAGNAALSPAASDPYEHI